MTTEADAIVREFAAIRRARTWNKFSAGYTELLHRIDAYPAHADEVNKQIENVEQLIAKKRAGEQRAASLDKQEGGDHYKQMPLQPWEIIDSLNLDYYDGNAVKYVLRWRAKGGVEDLKKAIHYIEHQIEKQVTP